MKDQVLSIEQMRELIELGIDVSSASMYYSGGSSSNKNYYQKPDTENYTQVAFQHLLF